MRWRGERESSNVEDQRGMSGGGRIAIGGGLGTLVIIIIAIILGADPRQLLQQMPTETQPSTSEGSRAQRNPEEEELKQFVSVVLGKTEDVWQEIFRQNGKQYREPKLVLFTDQVQRLCALCVENDIGVQEHSSISGTELRNPRSRQQSPQV